MGKTQGVGGTWEGVPYAYLKRIPEVIALFRKFKQFERIHVDTKHGGWGYTGFSGIQVSLGKSPEYRLLYLIPQYKYKEEKKLQSH